MAGSPALRRGGAARLAALRGGPGGAGGSLRLQPALPGVRDRAAARPPRSLSGRRGPARLPSSPRRGWQAARGQLPAGLCPRAGGTCRRRLLGGFVTFSCSDGAVSLFPGEKIGEV